MKNIMNELIENRIAELEASRKAIALDPERIAENVRLNLETIQQQYRERVQRSIENAEIKKAEEGLAKIENWKADPHKAMFGRYSSEWD